MVVVSAGFERCSGQVWCGTAGVGWTVDEGGECSGALADLVRQRG